MCISLIEIHSKVFKSTHLLTCKRDLTNIHPWTTVFATNRSLALESEGIKYSGKPKIPRFLWFYYKKYHTVYNVAQMAVAKTGNTIWDEVMDIIKPFPGDIIIMPDGDRWLVTEGGACLIVSS